MPIPPITSSSLLLTTSPIVPAPPSPRKGPLWVAVEFDLVGPDNNDYTLRLCNAGIVTRTVDGQFYEYDPRLINLPIQLGATITVTGSISVTQYGSPTRTQPNGGAIAFTLDETIWEFLSYHWVGRQFRVYEGESTDPARADVDADLVFVYAGRIVTQTHDTKTASIQTTDETLQWDAPLITDFYGPETLPIGLRGRPRPWVWGLAFSIKPEIIDEANLVYEVSHRPGGLDTIVAVRVGGIPWNVNLTGPPSQGEWTPLPGTGFFALGSPPLNLEVRCDAQQGTFTIADLITEIITTAGGEVDPDSMAALNITLPGQVGFATSTEPINLLSAIDDFTTAAGCWWGVNALGKVIAGVIDIPATLATWALTKAQINTLALNTIQAPAWRIRTGFQRNWEPETSFAGAVLQTEQSRQSATSRVLEPHFENNEILLIEPHAVDVPLLNSSFVALNDALGIQNRLVSAWGTTRSLFDVTAFLRPDDIELYDTIALDYMMVTGNFLITSAIRAIGGGPATLQLWGTLGPITVQPVDSGGGGGGGGGPPLEEITDMGMWTRNSGSGTFVVGVDTPPGVTRLMVRGIGGGGGGAGALLGPPFRGGGGGGAGGYFEDILTVSNGDGIGWSVGTGGAGLAFNVSGAAGSGTGTNFGAANGFGGGGGQVTAVTVDGGGGGSASGATILINGGPGGVGYLCDCDIFTANGASSPFGAGGHAATTFEPGGAPGTGGGGHVSSNPASGMPGNAGIIIVTWLQ